MRKQRISQSCAMISCATWIECYSMSWATLSQRYHGWHSSWLGYLCRYWHTCCRYRWWIYPTQSKRIRWGWLCSYWSSEANYSWQTNHEPWYLSWESSLAPHRQVRSSVLFTFADPCWCSSGFSGISMRYSRYSRCEWCSRERLSIFPFAFWDSDPWSCIFAKIHPKIRDNTFMGLGRERNEHERSAEDDKKNVLLSEVKHFLLRF